MSVSVLSSSGAPIKLAIGVPFAALIRNATICVADRLTAREKIKRVDRQSDAFGARRHIRL